MTSPEEDRILKKIHALLERASHSATPEAERESCREKAEQLMEKYRLDRALLYMNHSEAKPRDIKSKIVDPIEPSEYSSYIRSMRKMVFDHAGCATKEHYSQGMTVVGYEEDIFFAEMLWANIHLDFAKKMFPVWDIHKGFDANVFDIKNAGYGWPQVRDMGLAKAAYDKTGRLTFENAGSKLRTAYKREAKRRGIEVLPGKQQPMNPQLWRESFVAGFAETMRVRFAKLADDTRASAGKAGEIALVRDKDRVMAEFYRLFPSLHPDEVARRNREAMEYEEKRRAAMTQAERDKEDRENARWARKTGRTTTRRADMRGWSAGNRAAEEVNLNRSSNTSVGGSRTALD